MAQSATFSHGAAQTQPDAAVNGLGSPDKQQPFVQRVASIPIVNDTINQTYSVIQSNSYSAAAYTKAESVASSVYNSIAPPIQKNFGSQLEAVDSYANKSLDYVEKKFPTAFEPTNDVIAKARKPADDAVAGVQARLGPYTGQIQNQLQQAQVNLHTVQEKLASVVASLPRSPKEVQSTATDLAHNLLAEVEKIRDTVTASAKELPSHVQSTIHTLSEQLQHAANDIRAELNRTDIPLTTRAANVLTYSRTNTEKAIRDALERVSTILSKKSSEAEGDAKKAIDTTQAKVNNVKSQASH